MPCFTTRAAVSSRVDQNGIRDQVEVVYKTEHAELAALLSQGQADVALLPQPFVTTALSQNDKLRVALDLTQEWDKVAQGASGLTMGCVIAQRPLAEEGGQLGVLCFVFHRHLVRQAVFRQDVV